LKYAPIARILPVDAGLRLAVKKRPVVVILKHKPLINAVNHFACLRGGGIETEVLQDDESVQGKKQAWVFLRPGPVTRRSLDGEKLGSPAFGCDARPLGRNLVRGSICEVPHDLPANGRVRIQKPFERDGPGCVIV
jgi:hypothetical protein